MNGILSPAEMMNACTGAGVRKCALTPMRAFLLAILAGALIALGGAATNTAAHSAQGAGTVRLICGLLFPFGLGIVILTGSELFTGNCLIAVPLVQKKVTPAAMLKNWMVVYCGNFVGALLVASCCAFTGQMNYSNGGLALFTMKLAAGKCALSFGSAVALGIACNVLVCLGVLCAMTARDTVGKIFGAFLPVALFVLCGFEHSVANMFYVPAGLFAASVPEYAAMAVQSGLDLSGLTWDAFLLNNLLPVTIGNIIGGAGVGLLLHFGHRSNDT